MDKSRKIVSTDEDLDNQAGPHRAARPLKFVMDKKGGSWLCDADIDVDEDLEAQGCWRCEEIAFPFGGR
ncbi:MAG: hypothetical protein R6X25_00760 [Candidatus Krumholzibacteriia bacterium]